MECMHTAHSTLQRRARVKMANVEESNIQRSKTRDAAAAKKKPKPRGNTFK